ncbi:MAG: hypothetical protein DHS20C13_10930 [Thermodesulfobacteriota bacterium]|nr:MAG: hypothetical protein DHS20C13_10930 [Thermodesulfobacteriota bacterium]
MLFKIIIHTIFLLFIVLNSQLVFAHSSTEGVYDYISEKVEVELETGIEYRVIGSESDVLLGLEKILFITPIQEEFGYSPTSKIFIDQPFDEMFYYGLEIEVPTFRKNTAVVSEVAGEFAEYDTEKPIYHKTSFVYEANDQIAIDCGFEIGLYHAESSKAILIGIAFTY